MNRRDLLRSVAAAGAVAMLPRDATAAWQRVAAGIAPTATLTDAQLAIVAAVADTILPRSTSPSATDVKVPAFVNVVVSENFTDAERATFTAGLTAIEAFAARQAAPQGAAAQQSSIKLASMTSTDRAAALTALEARADRKTQPGQTYWRLKGLIIHGYFTSEAVQKQVLHVNITPGRFDGAVPIKPAARGA